MATLAFTQLRYRGYPLMTHGWANVLIYSATMGYRHDSIPTAVGALASRSATYNITFDHSEDPSWFRQGILQKYDAIVFLSTTGEVLDSDGKTAFQDYLNGGGNFVGIHSATDSLRNTTFYGNEIGAYLDHYSSITNITVNVLTKNHLSASMLPDRWEVTDQIYYFESDPRNVGAVVILSVNGTTSSDPGFCQLDQDQLYPIAWYQERGSGVQGDGVAGRSFYTGLGHLNETWQDELFLSHVFGGITWALDSGTTTSSNRTNKPDEFLYGADDIPDTTDDGFDNGFDDSGWDDFPPPTTDSGDESQSGPETTFDKLIGILCPILLFIGWIPFCMFVHAACGYCCYWLRNFRRRRQYQNYQARTVPIPKSWREPEMASSAV